ncbi:MAG TPA: hypothetical protein VF799_12585 [Geobacteraceae bacterium]
MKCITSLWLLIIFSLVAANLALAASPATDKSRTEAKERPGRNGSTKPTTDAERAELKAVEWKFVTDHINVIKFLKKKYGGGHYNIARLEDSKREFMALKVAPPPATLLCDRLFYVDMRTKKEEVTNRYYYCSGPGNPELTAAYTKVKDGWAPLPAAR